MAWICPTCDGHNRHSERCVWPNLRVLEIALKQYDGAAARLPGDGPESSLPHPALQMLLYGRILGAPGPWPSWKNAPPTRPR